MELLTDWKFLALIVAVISLAVAIHKNFKKPDIAVRHDDKNRIISKISSSNPHFNNKFCVGFYAIKIVGVNEVATSINIVKFFVRTKKAWIFWDKWVEGELVPIQLHGHQGEEKPHCLHMRAFIEQLDVTKNIHLMHWNDIAKLYDRKLSHGEVLVGSFIFLFEISHEVLKNADLLKFIIYDNLDRKYEYTLINDLMDLLDKYTPEGYLESYYVMDYPHP